ncbi:unknown [Antheraea pernyi nucleopolyhedrovirus]|uniref:Uncharacterized protein n=2 Tax=Antheraea pernyi nuclear polyhedrosis virus TaxID=161494 RepID=Q1HGY8_NPVAP|nr:hypothetical protein APNV_p111 [Antheraea pernyi nucleopolyhedrovirus]AWD33632.1 hypothetical protein [Antheraea proylei nucleopolyhedrovirus]BBD50571.1 hypothetical protein [Antheraea yamamai nucleopolyhedrovirus]BBD50723.1 hypothetical protein [Samia cynthia nucleopolyhedrovirus]ABF50345.1 unknown [Antheraea pernyi nucleopolyhedrovirus]ABQ12340.1 unknown [Antheraea pernyi nucleopolyhedrovirus]
MEHVLPNTCAEGAFTFTTDDLLKNLPFSSSKCAPFKLHHYAILRHLSNGALDKCVDAAALAELGKLNFKIDPEKRYITNVLDYEFVVLDHDLSTVHVVNAETRCKIGHLNVSLRQNDASALLISATLAT